MKKFYIIALLLISTFAIAQKDGCDFEIKELTDSTSTHVLRENIVYENIYGSTSSFLTFKLYEVDGVLGLNLQYIQKSQGFLEPICVDKSTTLSIYLNNGKEIKLINSLPNEICNNLSYDPVNKNNIRILTCYFNFTPTNFNELKTEEIYLLKMTATTGEISFAIPKKLNSEIFKGEYYPSKYFISNLKCFF